MECYFVNLPPLSIVVALKWKEFATRGTFFPFQVGFFSHRGRYTARQMGSHKLILPRKMAEH